MIKRKSDFSTTQEFLQYTKTADFLLGYCWENKNRETIIEEMALPDYEQEYLDAALSELKLKGEYSGMALDRLILRRLDESYKDDFNLEGIVFLKRDE